MFATVDIMPTVLGLMGLGDRIPSTVAGRDFSRELLSGDWDNEAKPRSALFLGYGNRFKGVRTDRYSFQIDEAGEQLLWDNVRDPYQMNPISIDDLEGSEADFLLSELGYWLKESGDPWATERKFEHIIRYPA